MRPKYREAARQCLTRAKLLLMEDSPETVRYAAVELRMAIEGLIYDKADKYREDIPPSKYQTWQPKKLLELLLDIDPKAELGGTLSVARASDEEDREEAYQTLGTERPLSLAEIKAHYDALGSCIHMPTLKQIESRTDSHIEKIRSRCERLILIVPFLVSNLRLPDEIASARSLIAAC
ncbi:MAG: hypothetical protein ACTSVG_05490 [Alphaproteobacteria bacterium]